MGLRSRAEVRRFIEREALRVALTYGLVAAVWIVLSDRAVSWYAGADSTTFQTVKGLFFVAFTSALVYWQSVRGARRLAVIHEERSAAERRLESLLAAVEDCLVLVDGDLRVVQASPTTAGLLGRDPDELAGFELADVLVGGAAAIDRLGLRNLEAGRFTGGEASVRGPDGAEVPVRVSVGIVDGPDGRILVLILHDLRAELAERASLDLDPATGQLRSEALLYSIDGHDGPLWIVLVRVDPTAPMILGLGHPSLDEILADQGDRLQASGASVVGRWDNATTVGVFTGAVGMADEADLAPQADQLVRALAEQVPLRGRVLTVPISAGLVRRPADRADPAGAGELIHRAEIAQQGARRSQRRWVIYNDTVGDAARRTAELEIDLRTAVDQGLLVAAYQTIHDAADGRVVGAEALCRWNRAGHGPLEPDRFIPLAEESDLIEALDLLMLRTACAQAASWPDHELAVSVNLSARSLARPDLPQRVRETLAAADLPPHRLVLEVTEHGLASDPQRADGSLAELRNHGVRVAIDDFGTGYSSLDRVLSLRADQWKIDRSLVTDVARPERRAFIEAIVSVAQSLGCVTVAEGVETNEQLRALVDAGVDRVQGFLLSRPVPATELPLAV